MAQRSKCMGVLTGKVIGLLSRDRRENIESDKSILLVASLLLFLFFFCFFLFFLFVVSFTPLYFFTTSLIKKQELMALVSCFVFRRPTGPRLDSPLR